METAVSILPTAEFLLKFHLLKCIISLFHHALDHIVLNTKT